MLLRTSCDPALDGFLKAHGVPWDMFADSLLEASRNGCTAAARDGRVLYANRMARDGLGIRPGIQMPDQVPELRARIEGVLAGEADPGGPLVRRGDSVYLTTVSRVQNGGKILGTLCVFIDVTLFESTVSQMRAYAELARQQDAIINSLSEGLWICDGQAKVMRINPAS
jgi:PAS domain-containing protein